MYVFLLYVYTLSLGQIEVIHIVGSMLNNLLMHEAIKKHSSFSLKKLQFVGDGTSMTYQQLQIAVCCAQSSDISNQ